MGVAVKARLGTVLRGLVALAAAGAIVLVVERMGWSTIAPTLSRLLPWIPVLLALEGLRIGSDAFALRTLCGEPVRSISRREWLRFHLAANAALVVLPGGRAVSEGIKIARLKPLIGTGRAAAAIVTLHVTTLLGIASISIGAALLAWIARAPLLASALLIHAGVCLAGGFALRAASSRAKVPPRWVDEAVIDDFRAASRSLPIVPRRAMAAKLLNRGAQVAQFSIVLASVKAGVLASGVSLLGGIVSDLSIASIGATDGAFALAAPALALAVPSALLVAGIARLVSLVWSAASVFV